MTTRILIGDCRDVLRTLPDESVHCAVTSPPYFGLRDCEYAEMARKRIASDAPLFAEVGT